MVFNRSLVIGSLSFFSLTMFLLLFSGFVYETLVLLIVLIGSVFFMAIRKDLRISKYDSLLPVEEEKTSKEKFGIARLFYYVATFLIPMLILRPIAGITLSDILYFLAIGTAVGIILFQKKMVYINFNVWLIVGIMLFILGALLSSFGAGSPILSLTKAARFPFIVLIWFWLSIILLKNEQYVYTAFKFWIASIAFNGFIATLQLKFDIPYAVVQYGRMTAFTGNMSDLGAITSIAWIPALILATNSRLKYSLLGYLALIFIGLGVLLSGSVSGLITVAAGTLIWLAIGRPSIKLLILGAVLSVIVISVINIQEKEGLATPFNRIETATSLDATNPDSTMMSRLLTYQAGMSEIANNPVVGVGFDGKETETGFEVHNIFLGALYQGGIFSFLGMIIICMTILKIGYCNVKNSHTKLIFNLSLAVFISFICMLVFGMTGQFLYQRYAWIPAALLLALYNIMENKKADLS
ncbi:O-antigen ligase family protein [Planococcus sp. CAU13]|uniref:O-antigen ligase family protein n=1 Tax=Planococcus sp. CAU13 TaxID=1541197 RepID=UPI00052FFAC6|nr:O-antigen ligase family protein [Planococcus sp. CAU13]